MGTGLHLPRSIVILDFGGQYAHLIARRVRECGAYSEILPPETSPEILHNAAGIIHSGGPQSVYDEGSPQADQGIFALGIPILGICYGHQWLAHALGGKVKPGHTKEFGHSTIRVENGGLLLGGLPEAFSVWMSHGDEVSALPEGFACIASSEDCSIAAMGNEHRKIFGVQFHVEVTHTEHGLAILRRFVSFCHPAPWSVEGFAEQIGGEIMRDVGDRNVFMLVSGGVDSTVSFTLLNEVLGAHRVRGLLVDTGLMRKGEIAQIREAFGNLGITNLTVEDASEEFFRNLRDVFDPEEKRRIIGDTFLAVQRRVSRELNIGGVAWMLGQGTIYPDTIETGGTTHADHIKTHHNRVEAIQKMIEAGRVIEPLKDLYKDEVRKLGEELGLPNALVWRHPFPGPGLGVRILCASEAASYTSERLGLAGQLPRPNGHSSGRAAISFAYEQCKILPVRSVGVQGDARTYRHAVVFFTENSCVVTEEMYSLATSIPNKHPAFNRVLQCTSRDKPVDFVFTPGFITRKRADLLREADAVVDKEMRRAGWYERIWQFPVVLLPFGSKAGGQSIVLRPVESEEAMTANAAVLPEDLLKRMTERLTKLTGIDLVFEDLTSKPPATIEWE